MTIPCRLDAVLKRRMNSNKTIFEVTDAPTRGYDPRASPCGSARRGTASRHRTAPEDPGRGQGYRARRRCRALGAG